MTERPLVAGVAIENASYSFDKLYDYSIPEEMRDSLSVGCRVKVSFGRGLRQGMVLSLHERDNTEGLKKISLLIDREPVLSEELVQMVFFMKERCYCTLFDAVSAMLPTGLSVRLTYSYSAAKNTDFDSLLLEADERAILEWLSVKRSPVREDRLLKVFPGADASLLRGLAEKGAVIRTEVVKKRIADASVKMIRLRGDVPERRYTPSQNEVLRVLSDTGEVSVKEICYFTGVSQAVTDNLVKLGICEYFDAEPPKQSVRHPDIKPHEEIALTPQQDMAYRTLLSQYESGKPCVSLLYGVTGSGKTSVFMKLIDEVNAQGRGVICMVPEISLTPQLLSKFHDRYGSRVAVFHSGLSLGKRLDEWKRVRDGEADIAVGTRSAIFAPLKNIGLIVIDEEQEYSYKSSASPRFHARELAKFRCSRNNCPLVLSSATPSVESYNNAVTGRYSLCRLGERYGSAVLPHVIVADMNIEQQQGNISGYSSVLAGALEDNLSEGRQSIILLNRRGHNTFVTCRECGQALSCPNCSISLTYHSANHRLMCHYCGYSTQQPEVCPDCGSKKLRFGGTGTQRAEQELSELFPKARILRLDTDSTMQRYSYEKKLGAFRDGEYDIMLGTQMVAKGLDFPNVTLVGVLSADNMMHADDFRSYERTFSLLTQVVGRSGRGGLEGRAVIQTFEPENPIISLAAAQNYEEFFKAEISLRRSMLYPPFADIAVAVFAGEDKQRAEEASRYFSSRLRELAEGRFSGIPLRVLGPSPALVSRVGGKYRFRIIIKFKNSRRFREMMSELLLDIGGKSSFSDVSCYLDVDPDNII